MRIYACSFMAHKIPGKRLRWHAVSKCTCQATAHRNNSKEYENEATWGLHSEERLQWISETHSRPTTEVKAGT